MVHLISAKGYIEREVVAEIYHYSNYSTFEFRKGESEYTLWEGNQKKCCIIIYMHIINIAWCIKYVDVHFGAKDRFK